MIKSMQIEIFDHMEQCTETEVRRMLPLVNAQRREQALKYKHTFGQFCCLKSWLLLSSICLRYNSDISTIRFLYNEHGKPYLEEGPFFSISHCKEAIAVAVSDRPIGIDVESIRRVDEDLIARTMNEAERERVRNERDFTQLWTQKEAVVKCLGTGIESFEQLQGILECAPCRVESVEKEKYIYSIAYKN